MYYNQMGQPIDMYGRMLTPLNQPQQQAQHMQNFPPLQRPLPPHMQPQGYNNIPNSTTNWDLLDANTQPEKVVTSSVKCQNFQIISDSDNIQELGNKDARLGDILYFYNPSRGLVIKKYVDFLSGQMITENAQFNKVVQPQQSVTPVSDPRIDQLNTQIEAMKKEIEDLKELIFDDKNSA